MNEYSWQHWRGHVGTLIIMLLTLVHLPAIAAERPSDSSVATYVREALQQDERVDASQITVTVKSGVVKLVGKVDNLAGKKFADQEAKKINGVLGVVNELFVEPSRRLDSDIAHSIRRRILSSADIDSQRITVTVVKGKVTLHGTVGSYSESEQAKVLAMETAGVTAVDNKLSWIWTATRSDDAIKKDIVAAIGRDAYLSGQDISVSVKDGNVTLSGSVGNAYEKDKAGHDAWYGGNVKSVKNNLSVIWWKERGTREETAHRSDSELKRAVLEELEQDNRVNADKVTVIASNGHVTLDGSVRSHYQRRIAAADAKDVIGVGWVTNNLFANVDKRADWLVEDDLEFNIASDYTLAGFELGTSVKDGVVTLSGDVHTWYQKFHARELAHNIKGVRKVVNKISVHYSPPKSDSELAKDVRSRLRWNWTTWPVHNDIKVTVSNGVARLAGDVNTWGERSAAASVAFKTTGIWRVDNRLTVNGYDYRWDDWYFDGPYVYDPYYDAYELWPYYYDYDYYRTW